MLNKIRHFIIREGTIENYKFYLISVFCLVGHPTYWALWTYIDPKEWENGFMRIIGVLSAIPLVLNEKWPTKLARFRESYLHIAIAYNLPFLFTYLLVVSHYSTIWTCASYSMLFITIMLIPDLKLWIINVLAGATLAILTALIFSSNEIYFDPEWFLFIFSPVATFSIFTGICFTKVGDFALGFRVRSKLLKSLAGSIAHEIRNPLNNIALVKNEIADLIKSEIKSMADVSSMKTNLQVLNSHVCDAVSNANNVINMILADLSEKPIDASEFAYLRPEKMLPQIIKKFGYKSNAEKLKVKLDPALLQDLARNLAAKNNSPLEGQRLRSSAEFNNSPLEGQRLRSSAEFNNSPLEGQRLRSSAEFNNSPLEGESNDLRSFGGGSEKHATNLGLKAGSLNLTTNSSSQSNSALLTPHGSKDLTVVKSFSPAPPQGGSCVAQPNLLQNFQPQGDGYKNFFFKAVPERFEFIVFNLIKNALYYTDQFPDSEVILGAESREIDGKAYNSIFVLDFGPGIPKEIIPKLFDDFFTSGKSGGTGLGLSFCKRNMQIFGGDIICESHQVSNSTTTTLQNDKNLLNSGQNSENCEKNLRDLTNTNWTKFSLLFPKLSDSEQQQAAQLEEEFLKKIANSADERNQAGPSCEEQKPRKILIVDDERTNLVINKSKIEKFLKNVVCDIAGSGAVGYQMFEENYLSGNPYELILMDIQMPDQDGAYTTKRIRDFLTNKAAKQNEDFDLPIIALTSLDFKTFSAYATEAKAYFSDYINKSSSNNIFCRTTAKWLIGYKDDFAYLANDNQTLYESLQGKEILLADDQELNRMMYSRMLSKYGMKVTESSNGLELVEHYKKSLIDNTDPLCSQTKISKFSIIATDINMPSLSGSKACEQIREIENDNFTKKQKRIPIIAFSGDNSKKEVFGFFKSQLTDYFTKGTDSDLLIKIILNYLRDDEGKKEASCEDNLLKTTKDEELARGITKEFKNDGKNSDAKEENASLNAAKKNEQESLNKPIQEGFKVQDSLQKFEEKSEEKSENSDDVANQAKDDYSEFQLYKKADLQQSDDEFSGEFASLKICNREKIDFFEPSERAEIIQLYLDDSKDKIAKLKQAATQSDLQQISFNIHALKGISANVGGDKLVAFIRKIEPYFKNNSFPDFSSPKNPTNEQNWLAILENFYNQLKAELEKIG